MLREREWGGMGWLVGVAWFSFFTLHTQPSSPTHTVATSRRSGGDDAYMGVLYPADDFVVYG